MVLMAREFKLAGYEVCVCGSSEQSQESELPAQLRGVGRSNVHAYWRSFFFVFHSRPWIGSVPFWPRGRSEAPPAARSARGSDDCTMCGSMPE